MKVLGTVVTLWLAMLQAGAQTITDIRTSVKGDTILLSYRLTNTVPGAMYRLRVYCVDGIEETELKNVSGSLLVQEGAHQLKWAVLSDMDLLVGDSVYFRFVANEYKPEEQYLKQEREATGTRPQFENRALLRAELTREVEVYLDQLYNQAVIFRNMSGGAFQSRTAYQQLQEQIRRTNAAYDLLMSNRRKFESSVSVLYDEDRRKFIADYFIFILDTMHKGHLLPFNDILKDMNDYAMGNFGKSGQRRMFKDIQDKIERQVKSLDTERDIAKSKTTELYKELVL